MMTGVQKYGLMEITIGMGILMLERRFAGRAGALSNGEGGSRAYSRITISNHGAVLSDHHILVSLSCASFPIDAKADGAYVRFLEGNKEKHAKYHIFFNSCKERFIV